MQKSSYPPCLILTMLFLLHPSASVFARETIPRETGIKLSSLFERMRSDSGEEVWANEYVADDELLIAGLDYGDVSDIRRGIDLVPGYEWLEGKLSDGGEFHVLGPDWEEIGVWAKLATKDKARKDAEFQAAAIARLRGASDALALSDEELAKRTDDDPGLVRALSSPLSRQIISYLASLPQDQLQWLFDRNGLILPLASLPPEWQSLEIEAYQRLIAMNKGTELENASAGYMDIDRLLAECTLTLRCGPEGFEKWKTRPEVLSSGGAFLLPRSLYAGEFRTALRDTSGMSSDEAEALRLQDEEKWRKVIREENVDSAKKRIEHDPPRFGIVDTAPKGSLDVPLDAKQACISLSDLCQKNKWRLVSQYYKKRDARLPVALDAGTPLTIALDWIADTADSVWAFTEGPTVLLAGKHFIDDMFGGTPANLVVEWRKRVALRGGVLTLDDLAEIAASRLSDIQIRRLPDDIRKAAGTRVSLYRKDLVFYSSLTPDQRAAAWRKEGIPFDALTFAQKHRFGLAASLGMTIAGPGTKPRLFKIRHEGEKTVFDYFFSSGQLWSSTVVTSPPSKPETASATKSDLPAPTSAGVRAALALAKWTYVGRSNRDGQERAILRMGIGDWEKGYLVPVGADFEGLRLTTIGSKSLTFKLSDGTEIRMPLTGSVSLPPYKVK